MSSVSQQSTPKTQSSQETHSSNFSQPSERPELQEEETELPQPFSPGGPHPVAAELQPELSPGRHPEPASRSQQSASKEPLSQQDEEEAVPQPPDEPPQPRVELEPHEELSTPQPPEAPQSPATLPQPSVAPDPQPLPSPLLLSPQLPVPPQVPPDSATPKFSVAKDTGIAKLKDKRKQRVKITSILTSDEPLVIPSPLTFLKRLRVATYIQHPYKICADFYLDNSHFSHFFASFNIFVSRVA